MNVVYDHEDWLVVDKPAGLNFHTEDGQPGLMVQLEHQLGTKLWPVHRLDKLTSGLVLVAKNKDSCALLSKLFSERKVDKYYLAVTPSSIKKKQGLIKGDMSPARRGAFKLLKTMDNPAITQFFSHSLQAGYRICLLKPKTGKTHQLRVALKSISAPIVGDGLYSGETAARMYLHSFVLRFTYKDKPFVIVSEPVFEPDFSIANMLDDLAWLTPWQLPWPRL
ncbi:TIGR01621 family pseudouridine synthase [Oceaniserpentilla sp. 4NH20-0058]|uniref:TIGR01621 family pseudouridine synthase n=1 Tax=Oceaniserpentilla sp. 4NH20-0058 TaxID=3127660 RepID=UPI003102BA7A